MNTQADSTDVNNQPEDQVEEIEQDQTSGETPADDDAHDDSAAGDDDEVVVSIGEESPPSEEDENRAPEWVRELRKSKREADRRIREQEQEIARLKGASAPAEVVVGTKPTLEACDYDTDRFERELADWHQRKLEKDAEDRKKQEAAKAEQQAWQAKLDSYGKAKTELKVKDFDDAEDMVKTALNVTQQGVILHGAENPALLVYALGKNPKKAKELASISDPVKFAFAVAKLETQLKVTPRKAAPVPEKQVRGSAPVSGAVDKTLERLEAEAERTGDRSKVIAHKRMLKQKAA